MARSRIVIIILEALIALALAFAIVFTLRSMARAELPSKLPEHHEGLLFVLLRENNGQRSVHVQVVKYEDCLALLAQWRDIAEGGSPIVLTFPPKAAGILSIADCVRPDNTVGERFIAPAPST